MSADIEAQLTRIWRELIQLDNIDREDDFFDLCGNSLVAMRLFERIEETIRREVNIEDLVRYPTIASMSAYLAGKDAPTCPDIAPGGK
jgi:acyl carrier protein